MKREMPANVGKPWDSSQDTRLAKLYREGCPPDVIAKRMQRTRYGIVARLEHMGLLADVDVERYVKAAKKHGEYEDPDHEVGDLQEYLRIAWGLMTPDQHRRFAAGARVQELLECS